MFERKENEKSLGFLLEYHKQLLATPSRFDDEGASTVQSILEVRTKIEDLLFGEEE